MALVPPMFGGFPLLPPTDGWNNEGSGTGSYRESPVLEIIEFKFSLSNLLYNLRQITESIPATVSFIVKVKFLSCLPKQGQDLADRCKGVGN